MNCGFLPDEGTALLAVERFAPANFALIVKPCLIAVIMKLCKVVLNKRLWPQVVLMQHGTQWMSGTSYSDSASVPRQ